MNKRSRTEYSLMNMFTSFFGYALNIILSFLCRMVFVRCLTEEYLGVSGLFTNIISILSLSELGIGTAIVYALYKPIAENNEPQISALMKIYGTAYKIIGLFIFCIGLLCIPFLDFIINDKPNIVEDIRVIYLLYLFSTASSYFFSYRSSILTASQRNYVVLGISYLGTILQNLVQIIVLLLTRNFMLYLIIQVICTYLSNIAISIKAKKDYPYICSKTTYKLTRDEVWNLVKNIKALTITKISGILVNNTDNIAITYFGGLASTGIASNYTLVSSMFTSLLNQFFGSMGASIGNINATEKPETKYFYFKVINFSNFWLYGWGAIGIALVLSDIVELCFGSNYVLPISIPIIIAINFYIVGMQSAVWTFKSTLGLFKYGQYLLFITASLNIVGDIILGEKLGVFGIFLATVISRILTNCWYDPYVVFKHGFHKKFTKYFLEYLWYFLVLLVAAILCFVSCVWVNFSPLANVIFKIIICSIVPNVVFYLFFHSTEKYQYFVNKVHEIISLVVYKSKGLVRKGE